MIYKTNSIQTLCLQASKETFHYRIPTISSTAHTRRYISFY